MRCRSCTRLAELESAGVLERDVIDARPPRVEYRLTARGLRLQAVVAALQTYARAEFEAI